MSSTNDYLLIDEETVKTYLFNSLANGEVQENFGSFTIQVKGVKYSFSYEFNLWSVSPASNDAYAITTKGFIKWKNPTRVIYVDLHNAHSILSLLKTELICSNYICIDLPLQNYLKINKENIVKLNLDNYKYEELDMKETNKELVINYHDDELSTIGIKIENKIYPLNFPPISSNKQIIISRGTCFRVDRFHEVGNTIKTEFLQNKFIDLCYEQEI